MNIILWLGAFWTLYGLAGVLGVQNIPSKYKGKAWTREYIRRRGVSWLLLGVAWILLYCTADYIPFDTRALLVLFAIPGIGYTIVVDRKYGAKLTEEE